MTALDHGGATAVTEHIDWLRSIGRSPETIKDRVSLLTRLHTWLANRDESRTLLTATEDDLAEWQRSISRMALESIAAYVGHAMGFYRWLARYHHHPDVSVLLVRPARPRRLPRPIDDESLQDALRIADGQLLVMLLLMAFCGLRCGEVARLQRDDIRDTDKPPVVIVHGKGSRQRSVRMPNDLGPQLRAIGVPLRGHIVLSETGRAVTPNRVSQLINDFLHDVVGVHHTAHSLRHWYGTHTYRVTRDLRLVQDMMGHASASTTAIYTAFAPPHADEMAAELDDRMAEMLRTSRTGPGAPRLRLVT